MPDRAQAVGAQIRGREWTEEQPRSTRCFGEERGDPGYDVGRCALAQGTEEHGGVRIGARCAGVGGEETIVFEDASARRARDGHDHLGERVGVGAQERVAAREIALPPVSEVLLRVGDPLGRHD
jgi:hypothetical protein